MLKILYEDKDILVVVKPAGIESQTSRRLEPDMVSEIKNYLHNSRTEKDKLSTKMSTKTSTTHVDTYVGVIHRLDKPVRGVMVYAKNQKSAAELSRQVQEGKMKKIYQAVLCGKPVDNVGKYVDYLLKDGKTNTSRIVDKSCSGAKIAELDYKILEVKTDEEGNERTLVEIHLHTGRHHQIRVQFAAHGTPLVGDTKYGMVASGRVITGASSSASLSSSKTVSSVMSKIRTKREPLALCAVKLAFYHPVSGRLMEFSTEALGGEFENFKMK